MASREAQLLKEMDGLQAKADGMEHTAHALQQQLEEEKAVSQLLNLKVQELTVKNQGLFSELQDAKSTISDMQQRQREQAAKAAASHQRLQEAICLLLTLISIMFACMGITTVFLLGGLVSRCVQGVCNRVSADPAGYACYRLVHIYS